MRPKNKPRLGSTIQSSFDCIFTCLLATPNNRQGTGKADSQSRLHGRDASCTIDEQRKSVSVAGAGLHFRPGVNRRAGRGAMNRALS
jgi:hypothetical protein